MPPPSDDKLWNAYRDTLFEAWTPLGPACIRIGQGEPRLDALLAHHGAESWCFVTAWNPRSEPLSVEANRERNDQLHSALAEMDLPCWFDGKGRPDNGDWVAEESFLALGVGRATAVSLGRRFGQNAVVWGSRGDVAELLDCREEVISAPMRSERIVAALLGTAIGDCLGAPVEGVHPDTIRGRFGVLRDFQFGGAPIWTDDTQQTLVLVESLVRLGELDPEWIGHRFVEMRDCYPPRPFGVHRGTGRGFRQAVNEFAIHRDWRRSGRPDRAGNGAAMRVAAIGAALFDRSDDELALSVVNTSLLTHREGRALAGALAVAWTAARLTGEAAFPIPGVRARSLLEDLTRWIADREAWMADAYPEVGFQQPDHRSDFSSVLRSMLEAWDGGWKSMKHRIETFARTRHDEQTYASAGFVLCSVASAIGLVLCSTDSFEDTLVRAVNLGGDADTLGAMVGGLAGAAAGPSAFPARWLTFPGRDPLEAVGRALASRDASVVPALPDLLALEVELTRRLG